MLGSDVQNQVIFFFVITILTNTLSPFIGFIFVYQTIQCNQRAFMHARSCSAH